MDGHTSERNVVGTERFLRGLVGAALVSWALNGHPAGWIGLLFTATAVMEYCPLRGLLSR